MVPSLECRLCIAHLLENFPSPLALYIVIAFFACFSRLRYWDGHAFAWRWRLTTQRTFRYAALLRRVLPSIPLF